MLTCESAYTRATCSAASLASASGNLMFGAMMLPWPTTWKAAALRGKFAYPTFCLFPQLASPPASPREHTEHTRRHNGNLNETPRVLQLNASPSPSNTSAGYTCKARPSGLCCSNSHSPVIRSSARQQ